jgi:hypothetical protein
MENTGINSLLLFMSMGRDYVSELRPSTGLFFSPKMLYECGELWWNDITGKTEELGEKPVPMLFHPTQITYRLLRA